MMKRKGIPEPAARLEGYAEFLFSRSEDRFDLRVALQLPDHSLHFAANGVPPEIVACRIGAVGFGLELIPVPDEAVGP